MLRFEKSFRSVDGQLFGHIDVLAASVIPVTRVALCVLIRQHAALAVKNGSGHEIFRRNHFEGVLLPTKLGIDGCGHLWVDLRERAVEEVSC
jgi:hypothetical protein